MPQTLTSYDVMEAGGFETRPQEQMLGHYSHLYQGPDVEDAVVFNKSIDNQCRPDVCAQRYLPKGRIFSLTPTGKMVPGVLDEHQIPIAGILVGSDAHDGDVIGGPRVGNPATSRDAQVPIKDAANAPFWSLGAGYLYETSEFDSADTVALAPTTPLTAVHHMTNFDIAGIVKPGDVYVDHIIGTVYEGPSPCGVNTSINTIIILGGVVPRIKNGTLATLRP